VIQLHAPSRPDLLEDFLAGLGPRTAYTRRRHVEQMLRQTGRRDPADLTEADVIRWVTGAYGGSLVRNRNGGLANNTVRQRMATAREFLGYCARRGIPVPDVEERLRRLRKQYPRTYGKAQDKNPGRWLDRDQAFGLLLSACSDGTWRGSRDQLAIRLGLAGIRATGVIGLQWGHLDDNRLAWQDKGRKQNTRTLGPKLVELLARWRRAYERGLGRPIQPTDPILCTVIGPKGNSVQWGRPISDNAFADIIARRTGRAGLGHVAPHDLRRTTAGIMHRDRTADGGHRFDLRDIQAVLDHADPATTQRSYLDPIDHDAKDRAGLLLD
jgi:integrase